MKHTANGRIAQLRVVASTNCVVVAIVTSVEMRAVLSAVSAATFVLALAPWKVTMKKLLP